MPREKEEAQASHLWLKPEPVCGWDWGLEINLFPKLPKLRDSREISLMLP